MFKRKEKQSLLEARTKALENAEKAIENLKLEIKELKQIRLQEIRNNTKILEQSNKKAKFIKRITDLVNGNKYNNEKAVLSKIKELILDYHNQN